MTAVAVAVDVGHEIEDISGLDPKAIEQLIRDFLAKRQPASLGCGGARATGGVHARNDIADIFLRLYRWTNYKVFCHLANFFETLDGDPPVCNVDEPAPEFLSRTTSAEREAVWAFVREARASGCFNDFITGVQVDGMSKLAELSGLVAGRLQNLVACFLGTGPSARVADPGKVAACAWKAFLAYLSSRNLLTAVLGFFTCLGGDSGGGGGGTPGQGPFHDPVTRCP